MRGGRRIVATTQYSYTMNSLSLDASVVIAVAALVRAKRLRAQREARNSHHWPPLWRPKSIENVMRQSCNQQRAKLIIKTYIIAPLGLRELSFGS